MHLGNDNKWIKKDSNGISYVDKEENATEFKTNRNGERKIINLRAGKYQICETKNPNPGYGEQNLKKNIEIKEDEITNCILQNERKNINISGLS